MKKALTERNAETVAKARAMSMDGRTFHGVQTALAQEYGLTRERVRQILAETDLTAGAPTFSRIYYACARCGVAPAVNPWGGGALCKSCRLIPVMCDYCGVITYKDEHDFTNPSHWGEGRRVQSIQCSRAGRKKCPRGPVMFTLQLTREWQETWVGGRKYADAVQTAAAKAGFRVSYRTDAEGRIWMRRVE